MPDPTLPRGGVLQDLFGSNYPMLAPADCLAQVDELGLDDEARRLFLGENGQRVFRLDAEPA